MSDLDIPDARRLIAARVARDVPDFAFAPLAAVGWPAALDEVERLRATLATERGEYQVQNAQTIRERDAARDNERCMREVWLTSSTDEVVRMRERVAEQDSRARLLEKSLAEERAKSEENLLRDRVNQLAEDLGAQRTEVRQLNRALRWKAHLVARERLMRCFLRAKYQLDFDAAKLRSERRAAGLQLALAVAKIAIARSEAAGVDIEIRAEVAETERDAITVEATARRKAEEEAKHLQAQATAFHEHGIARQKKHDAAWSRLRACLRAAAAATTMSGGTERDRGAAEVVARVAKEMDEIEGEIEAGR